MTTKVRIFSVSRGAIVCLFGHALLTTYFTNKGLVRLGYLVQHKKAQYGRKKRTLGK